VCLCERERKKERERARARERERERESERERVCERVYIIHVYIGSPEALEAASLVNRRLRADETGEETNEMDKTDCAYHVPPPRAEIETETGYGYHAGPSRSQSFASVDAAACQDLGHPEAYEGPGGNDERGATETVLGGGGGEDCTGGPAAGAGHASSFAAFTAGSGGGEVGRQGNVMQGRISPANLRSRVSSMDVSVAASGRRGCDVEMCALADHWFGDKARPEVSLSQVPAVLTLSLRQVHSQK
jgi:hypothetical protein